MSTTVDYDYKGLVSKLEEKEGIVFLDFWASWCGPCKAFAPVYEKVAGEHDDITFGKVNTESEQELAAGFGIRSIPTLMVFREGVLLFRQPGMLPEEALQDLVRQVRALDMDEVRKEIAEQEAAEQSGPQSA